jgi:nitroreductase
MNNHQSEKVLKSLSPRQAGHPTADVFLQRWSPRAFVPLAMPLTDFLTILEAARWAPSAFNIQPWRFIYALRSNRDWDRYVNLLDPFNASWAKNASALVFLVSNRMSPPEGKNSTNPSNTHRFDAGAAWANLSLQSTLLGYQAHAMAGIRFDEVRRQLAVPDDYRVEIAVAIGRQADPATLPSALREREQPSSRLPLDQIVFPERFACQPAATRGGKDQ